MRVDPDETTRPDPAEPSSAPVTTGRRADLIAAGIAFALVVVAVVVGKLLWPVLLTGFGVGPLFGEWPILGEWFPHIGIGTPLAIIVALATAMYGPALAARLRWRTALGCGYLLAVAWTFTLAMIDGWQRGIANRLATDAEYLPTVPHITDTGAMLNGFARRILDFQPDSWPTHIAGHPPGATLVFVWLDRIGLSGGGAAGTVCVLVGCLAAVAVPATISLLGRHDLARAALPFVALFPGAVWIGASADGLFTGVTSCGIALLALGAARRSPLAGFAGGVLLGFGIFLSYGLVLMGPIAMAVIVVRRAWRTLAVGVVGALSVVAVFALAGFWWLDGYTALVERYYQGIASIRPYGYWVWANLACLALAVGPAAVAGLRRAGVTVFSGLRRRLTPDRFPLAALGIAAVWAVIVADLSGLSKSEVERIWLPFGVWLVATAALLPARSHRAWLIAQAGTALLVNHLILTNW